MSSYISNEFLQQFIYLLFRLAILILQPFLTRVFSQVECHLQKGFIECPFFATTLKNKRKPFAIDKGLFMPFTLFIVDKKNCLMILNSRVSLALLRNDDSQVEDVDPLGRRLQGRCRVGDNTQKKIFPQIL